MHAELTRLVTRRRNDAALIGSAAADDDGLAPKFRPFEQLDRNEKRIHVHVKDRSCRRKGVLVWGAMNRSKSCQFRHARSLRSIRNRANVLRSLRGDDARNASEIVCDADARPLRRVEERLHRWQAIVAELQHHDSAGLKTFRRLRDEIRVEFVAFFAAEERGFGLVLTNFAL